LPCRLCIAPQGFPTLIFFPAEEGADPIPYEGGRTLGDLTKFIKKHAKVPFELPKKKKKGEEGSRWCRRRRSTLGVHAERIIMRM
jgi:hypothetical protein